MNLKGKAALVTGSTQGIGLAIAEALARQGATIVLHGLCTPAEGQAQAAKLSRQWGVQVNFVAANLADAGEAARLWPEAMQAAGALHILVNNAGIQHTAPLESFPLEKWEAIQAINLRAPFLLSQAAVPHLREQGWGRIVNIASVHGLVASVHKAAYVAAKHGLIGLTRVTALETATDGITVNAICPGWTETPIIEPQIQARAAALGVEREAAIRHLVTEKQPNGTLMPTRMIGEVVAFLCSDAASGMTGAALPVDGGWTAQ